MSKTGSIDRTANEVSCNMSPKPTSRKLKEKLDMIFQKCDLKQPLFEPAQMVTLRKYSLGIILLETGVII